MNIKLSPWNRPKIMTISHVAIYEWNLSTIRMNFACIVIRYTYIYIKYYIFFTAPCSPGQTHGVHKHVRSTIRMSSMELPDENEKSYSSASTSPCPSPHTNNQNHLNPPSGKRVLPPNNLYVVLYNFEARHPDELDLK